MGERAHRLGLYHGTSVTFAAHREPSVAPAADRRVIVDASRRKTAGRSASRGSATRSARTGAIVRDEQGHVRRF
jgi:hypothetical protein